MATINRYLRFWVVSVLLSILMFQRHSIFVSDSVGGCDLYNCITLAHLTGDHLIPFLPAPLSWSLDFSMDLTNVEHPLTAKFFNF